MRNEAVARAVSELIQAGRTLCAHRGFTVVAVLALALGISGNTAMFSALRAVAVRSLPFPQSDRLVVVWESEPGRPGTDSVAPANFFAWRDEAQSFERLSAFFPFVRLTLSGAQRPEELTAASVSGDFFACLDRQPVIGRHFGSGTVADDSASAVLSEQAWSRLFARDPAVLGRRLQTDGGIYTVVGVMPADFDFPAEVDLWLRAEGDLPDLPVVPDRAERMEVGYVRVVGRLRPEVSLESARRELAEIQHRRDPQRGAHVVTLRDHLVGDVRPLLLLLAGAVALVLLIACANVANLLLVRGAGRAREMALRQAHGAQRWRIVRLMLIESAMVALAAGVAGAVMAAGLLEVVTALLPSEVRHLDEMRLDRAVLCFTLLLSLATSAIFGLVPALHSSRPDLVRALKEGSHGALGAGQRRAQSAFLISEIALTLVLLIGGMLLLQSFLRLQSVDPGFDTENLLSLRLNLPASRASEPLLMRQAVERILERLDATAQVAGVAASLDVPFTAQEMSRSFAAAGQRREELEDERATPFEVVSPGYFRTLGIPVLEGREFREHDTPFAPGVAVVSESVAARHFRDADAIGQRITFDDPHDPEARWLSVVGVVGDVRSAGPGRVVRPMVYRPLSQEPWPFVTLTVRARHQPEQAEAAIRRAVAEVDPAQPIGEIRTFEEIAAGATAGARFTVVLVGLFAIVATVLAAVGIYGVIAYAVGTRLPELGIRMAVGADRRAVVGAVLFWGLRIARWGVLIGIVASFALDRVLRGLLYGIESTDVPTSLAASALLLSVATAANLVPALRAARLEPIVALRSEAS